MDSFTIAKSTGVKANRKKPRSMRIMNERIPGDNMKLSKRIGFRKAERKSTFFLPILSEIVPDRNVDQVTY